MAISDTHPDMARKQIELIRAMPIHRRAKLASDLRNRTYWLARHAVEAANPQLTNHEQKLAFITINYGVDIAEHVKDYFNKRSVGNA